MLVRDVEIFLKKKKKRDVNIVMNDITFLEGEKQRLIYYIKKQVTPQDENFWIFNFYRLVLEYKKILTCWKFFEYKKLIPINDFLSYFFACPRQLHFVMLSLRF